MSVPALLSACCALIRCTLVGCALVGCGDAASVTSRGEGGRVTADRTPRSVAPLVAVEQLTGGASSNDSLPLLLTLHSRGITPERNREFFDDFAVPMRILHLQAPIDEGNGRAWWSFRGKTRAEVSAIIHSLAERVVASLRVAEGQFRIVGEPMVLGASQGAMVVYGLALDAPQAFGRAYAISGVLFESLLSGDLSRATPLVVLHGEDDHIIEVRSGTESVQPMVEAGADISVRTFADVPHWIMGGLKVALHEDLQTNIASFTP
ncbi:MAG: phospholipase/carboxylesterase [Polyangiales bacterium]|jgi:phospholipase/carboxylesterase